jgi:hypothetical protein
MTGSALIPYRISIGVAGHRELAGCSVFPRLRKLCEANNARFLTSFQAKDHRSPIHLE